MEIFERKKKMDYHNRYTYIQNDRTIFEIENGINCTILIKHARLTINSGVTYYLQHLIVKLKKFKEEKKIS